MLFPRAIPFAVAFELAFVSMFAPERGLRTSKLPNV